MYQVTPSSHNSVMLKEMLHYMQPKDGEIYIDGTFGAGGYSKAILNAANCEVYAIDRDPDVENFVKSIKEHNDRLRFILGKFSEMENLMHEHKVEKVHGVVLDIGVSSMQLDTGSRGFSFMNDGPLDMRMSKDGRDAAYLINNASEEEIADIIYHFGEEHAARRIAKKIVLERTKKEITTTNELKNIIHSVCKYKHGKIDPATKTFQALRIWVNDELGELEKALIAAEKLIVVGGRIVVISFHSLEDSIVKKYFNERSGKIPGTSRFLPAVNESAKPTLKLLTNNSVKPSDEEVAINPRSRSARLRAVYKLREEGN